MAAARRISSRFLNLASSADPVLSPPRLVFHRGLASVFSVKASAGWLSAMSPSRQPCLLWMLVLTPLLLHGCDADVGTAACYNTPYTLTTCGYDPFQFPSGLLFAAAGEQIWDNGAACGRQYRVRCMGADRPKACRPVGWIDIRIVDQASSAASHSTSDGATMVLSMAAYRAIADLSVKSINIEFVQV